MANTLSKSLGLNLADLAEMIRSKGRGKDTILAHITPKEAALLKKRGGRGSRNPDTGLLEFEDDYSAFDQASSDFQVSQGGDPFYQPDVSVAAPDVGSISQDPNYYGVPDGGQYQPYDNYPSYNLPEPVAPQAEQQAFAYPPNASPGYYAGGPEDVGPAGPGVLPSTGLPGTPEQVAKEYPQLYPGGRLPTAGEQTVYGPNGTAYYEPKTPIPQATPGTKPGGKDSDYSNLLSQLLRLGLGAGTAYALSKGVAQPAAKKAEDQAQQAKNERMGIAAPYQGIGKGLIAGAQAGNLSASNIQAVKAARAMAAQNISRTGGVGVLQGANSIADLEARLLDNQLIQGIKIANIGDNYAINAIQAGMAADNALAASQADFAKQLGVLLAPMVLGYSPNLPSGTPGTGIRQSTGALDAIANAGSDLLTGGGNYTNSLPTQRGEI